MKQQFLVIGMNDNTTVVDCWLSCDGIKKDEKFLLQCSVVRMVDTLEEAVWVAKEAVKKYEMVKIETVFINA